MPVNKIKTHVMEYEGLENISNRARFVRGMLTAMAALLAIISYFVSIYFFYGDKYPSVWSILNRDFYLVCLFIIVYWSMLETWLKLNEVYRSRSVGYVVLFHIVESVLGTMFLSFTIIILGLSNYGRDVLLLFGGLSMALCLIAKLIFYALLRNYRKQGYNNKTVVFIADKVGERLIKLILKNFEWGYNVKCVIGDEYITNKFAAKAHVFDINTVKVDELLTQEVDELIYARDISETKEMLRLIDLCSDLGITFRLYSPFFNRISSSTQLRYFDTHAVLTISNTPTNYVGMLAKRVFDIVFSASVLLIGMPIWLIVALAIKIDSPGPVFFTQKRSGLKGTTFSVYKFRTMCQNAEALKSQLMEQNEMSGPVFKITKDPRITRVGGILRKTGIDEIPQFLNVLIGDMSIVGPRPPLPDEVAQYERWQLRRLAMKPGITCLWQIAPERNTILFDEWMRMDMNYIDNWSFSLDMVIILKTVRTMLRADGK